MKTGQSSPFFYIEKFSKANSTAQRESTVEKLSFERAQFYFIKRLACMAGVICGGEGEREKVKGDCPPLSCSFPLPLADYTCHTCYQRTRPYWLPYDMTAMKSFKIYHTIVTYTLSPLHDLCLTKIVLQIKWPLFLFFFSFNFLLSRTQKKVTCGEMKETGH